MASNPNTVLASSSKTVGHHHIDTIFTNARIAIQQNKTDSLIRLHKEWVNA